MIRRYLPALLASLLLVVFTPARAEAAAPPLSWAPPAGYTSFPVQSPVSTTALNTVDGRGGDVLIRLPRDKAIAPLTIKNCRNAVLIGGAIKVLPVEELGGSDQRAIFVIACTGTVHLEGVDIEGNVAGSASDAIAISAPSAVVQMQNIRANAMRGNQNTHADVLQPWGGVREYRIDRLTGSSNFQGLHVPEPNGKTIGKGIIRNANIFSSGEQPDGSAGQYIWLPNDNQYPVTLNNVWISGRPGDPFSRSIWPSKSNPTCPATITGTPATASWPCSITGTVTQGKPTSGDFVPAGSVGLGYVSPGYR